jgi:hypothetical protein
MATASGRWIADLSDGISAPLPPHRLCCATCMPIPQRHALRGSSEYGAAAATFHAMLRHLATWRAGRCGVPQRCFALVATRAIFSTWRALPRLLPYGPQSLCVSSPHVLCGWGASNVAHNTAAPPAAGFCTPRHPVRCCIAEVSPLTSTKPRVVPHTYADHDIVFHVDLTILSSLQVRCRVHNDVSLNYRRRWFR